MIERMSILAKASIIAFMLHAWVVLAFAVDVTVAPVVVPSKTSASIRWVTDVECGTTVRYGQSADQLTGKVQGGVGTKHQVQLDGLKPGTRYYFSVGTAKKSLQTGDFITQGRAPSVENKPNSTNHGNPAGEPKASPIAAKVEGKPIYTPPPTARTWGTLPTLQDHFDRHAADFNCTSKEDYAARAWIFLQRAMDEGLPAKQDQSDGTIRVWEPKTRTFAAYNRNFTTKTYFRPNSPDYFQRQPGRAVKLRRTPAAL